MKRLKVFSLLIMTAVFCYAGSAQNQLIGGWMNVWPGKGTAVIEFKDDGTFSAEIHFKDGKVYSNGGTWKLENEKIIYEYRDSKGTVTQSDADELLSLTEHSFVILARDGAKRTYRRIEE